MIPDRDDPDIVHYFTSKEAADAFVGPEAIERARALAGAWSDLDWDEMEAGLDRIRRESKPAPPVEG